MTSHTTNPHVNITTTIPQSNELDNILVRQKDALINRIDSAKTTHQISSCIKSLELVTELWFACGYGYKVHELTNRIENALPRVRARSAFSASDSTNA